MGSEVVQGRRADAGEPKIAPALNPAPSPAAPALDQTLLSIERPVRLLENRAWAAPDAMEKAILSLFAQDEKTTSIDIGRGGPKELPRVQIQLIEVSSSHARLDRDPKSGSFTITDLNSTNGTFVRNSPAETWKRLTAHSPKALSESSEIRISGDSAGIVIKVAALLNPSRQEAKKASPRVEREGFIDISPTDLENGIVGRKIENQFAIPGTSNILGRAPDAVSVPGDPIEKISSRHVILTRTKDGYSLQDISVNGTWVSLDNGVTNFRLPSGSSTEVTCSARFFMGDTRNQVWLRAVARSISETVPAARIGHDTERDDRKYLRALTQSTTPVYIGRAATVDDPRSPGDRRIVDVVTGGAEVSRCQAILERGERGVILRREAWIIDNVSDSNPVTVIDGKSKRETKIAPKSKGYGNTGDILKVGQARLELPPL